MTPLEATQLVYEAARAAVAAGTLDCGLELEGERFAPTADEPWIRVAVRDLPNTGSTHGAAGARIATRRALVVGQCFAPTFPDDGVSAAMALAALFQALYEGRDLTGDAGIVNCDVGDTRRIGTDGAWFQVNASVPITFHETI